MASVCDDCKKKSICKPSRPYNFACQWKHADGKQKSPRDEWGIAPAAPKFCEESREDGWVAIKWTIEDVDTVIQDYGFHFEPALTQDEKMNALEQVVKYHNAAEGICWSTIANWLKHMYGNRLADDCWKAA